MSESTILDNMTIERIAELYRFMAVPEVHNPIIEGLSDEQTIEYLRKTYPELLIIGIEKIEPVLLYLIKIMDKNNHYLTPIIRSIYDKSMNNHNMSEEVESWLKKCIELMAVDSTQNLPSFPIEDWLEEGGFKGKVTSSYNYYNNTGQYNNSTNSYNASANYYNDLFGNANGKFNKGSMYDCPYTYDNGAYI